MSDSGVYRGKVITVQQECVELPNGVVCDLDIVRHPGGAAVVALNERNEICLLRQYRHAAGGWLWELPAGKIDNREPSIDTAVRELQEEAGLRADVWQALGETITSPGVMTEVIYLYLATGLHHTEQQTEQDEVIEVHWVDLAEASQWIRAGKITDAKTMVGIYKASEEVALIT